PNDILKKEGIRLVSLNSVTKTVQVGKRHVITRLDFQDSRWAPNYLLQDRCDGNCTTLPLNPCRPNITWQWAIVPDKNKKNIATIIAGANEETVTVRATEEGHFTLMLTITVQCMCDNTPVGPLKVEADTIKHRVTVFS
ncbi:MAG TPA: hypothetical protein VM490_16220, partial [Armatimonadaceae bacterium]|nr:hypothetical protein [Armatimonadaceae bacterium]